MFFSTHLRDGHPVFHHPGLVNLVTVLLKGRISGSYGWSIIWIILDNMDNMDLPSVNMDSTAIGKILDNIV